MSKSKILGIIALIAFAMGMVLVGNAVAGEKVKCRCVWHATKWEQTNVGNDKDHLIGLSECKGIVSNLQGRTFGEGWLSWSTGLWDISPEKQITANGYLAFGDRDGHMIYMRYEHKPYAPNRWAFFKGTGKFEGIEGKGTCSIVFAGNPRQSYIEWEGEVELPR